MELTDGRGVDAALDTVSKENATESLDMIAHITAILLILLEHRIIRELNLLQK